MDTTHISLLIRIKDPSNTEAWTEFYDIYAPLLYRYARARGLSHEDAEDVRSNCYEAIVRQLPHFDYDRQKGGFKAWLRTLVNRRVIDLMRKRKERVAQTQELEELQSTELNADELWDLHWRQQHLRHCMRLAGMQVSSQTFEAFRLLVEENLSVPDVCHRLSMSANQVYKAKGRVLVAVRELMQVSNFDED